MSDARTKVLLIGPTPPPFSGAEIATKLILDSRLKDTFHLIHLKSNLSKRNTDKGRVTFHTMTGFMLILTKLVFHLIKDRPELVYHLISQNRSGFLKDSVIIPLSHIFGARTVVHLHGGNFANFYRFSSIFFRRIIRFTLDRVDTIIVLAERLRGQFAGTVPIERTKVLYNAANTGDLLPVSDFSELAAARANRNGEVNVLYLGHLSYAKGFCDVLKAIPLILERAPQTRFMFAGERIDNERNILYDERGRKIRFENIEPLLNNLRKRFPSQVQLLGTVSGERKVRMFLEADIFTLPSYSEGFPMSVLESMAAGLPVITTPVGALPEILRDGINGFSVEPHDYHSLAEKIIHLVYSPELRKQIGHTNFEYAREKFSLDTMIDRLSDIFSESVQSGKS